jgi:hypothetical protein
MFKDILKVHIGSRIEILQIRTTYHQLSHQQCRSKFIFQEVSETLGAMTPMTPLTPLGAPDDIVIFTQPRREHYQRQVTMTLDTLI